MIKLFEVTGFKNFTETFTMDFSNVREYKFNKQCLRDNKVNKSIIYGKNSVGKSNFGLALFDIVSHLTSKNVSPNIYDYYINISNKNAYAEFHYIFEFGNDIIDYTYRKDQKQLLQYETIYLNSKLLFEYDYATQKGDLSEVKNIAPTLNMELQDVDSLLKYLISNTVLEENHPLVKLNSFVNNMLWFRSFDENRYIGYKNHTKDYFDFIFDDDNLKELEGFLKKAGVDEELDYRTNPEGQKILYFKINESLMPFFKVASSGTKALYTFFYWYKTAKNVSLMFIDEFDSFYHYELAETIIKLLGEITETQTIVTSHNTNLLTNRIMRPDCYYILTKERMISFADATQRELREGHNLEKLYMSGEFDQ